MPSRHSAAHDLISKGVFDDLSSFRVLEDRISALGDENSKAVGDALEIFVEAYLATQPIAQCEETLASRSDPTSDQDTTSSFLTTPRASTESIERSTPASFPIRSSSEADEPT